MMNMKLNLFIFIIGLGLAIAIDFQLTLTQPDGEKETFVRFRGRIAKELAVDHPQGNSIGLVQITNGRVLIDNIYNSEKRLIDCDIIKDKNEIDHFVEQFETSTQPILKMGQENINLHRLTTVEGHIHPLLNIRKAKLACYKLHKEMKGKRRNKRSLLISPGTQWCGAGSTAQHSNHFGAQWKTDRCCMEHDGCPYFIEGLTNKYNYFNYRFYTMSFCDCDLRFYQCLKEAGTGTARTVGKVFFNVVSRSCFNLKRKKICAKRSWWGSCNKWKSGLVAQIKQSTTF